MDGEQEELYGNIARARLPFLTVTSTAVSFCLVVAWVLTFGFCFGVWVKHDFGDDDESQKTGNDTASEVSVRKVRMLLSPGVRARLFIPNTSPPTMVTVTTQIPTALCNPIHPEIFGCETNVIMLQMCIDEVKSKALGNLPGRIQVELVISSGPSSATTLMAP